MPKKNKTTSKSLIGTETLSDVAKTEFRTFCMNKLEKNLGNTDFAKLDPEKLRMHIDSIYKNPIEKMFDVNNAFAGVAQFARKLLWEIKNEEKINEMDELKNLVLGSIDLAGGSIKPGKSIKVMGLGVEDGTKVLYSAWGSKIGNKVDAYEPRFGDKIKVRISTTEKDGNTFLNAQRATVEKSFKVPDELDKLLKILDANCYNIGKYSEDYWYEYEGEIFCGRILSIKPIPVLKEDRGSWNKERWIEFSQVDRYDNPTYSFQMTIVDPANLKNKLNVNFNAQVLGNIFLNFGHEKHFKVATEKLKDPAKEGIKDGNCFTEKDGEWIYDGSNCIPDCKDCIYSLLSRLAGKEVIVGVQMLKYRPAKKDPNIIYFSANGFFCIETGEPRIPVSDLLVDDDGEPEELDLDEEPEEPEEEELELPEDQEETQEIKVSKAKKMTDEVKAEITELVKLGLTDEDVVNTYPNLNAKTLKIFLKKIKTEKNLAKSDLSLKDKIVNFMQNNKGQLNLKTDLKTLQEFTEFDEDHIKEAIGFLIDDAKIYEETEDSGEYAILE